MKKTILFIVLFFILINFIFAQGFGINGAVDAKNKSMASTNAVSARGVYAIGVNPANLVIDRNYSFEFSTLFPLPTLNISAGNDFFTLNDYKYFFTGVENGNGEITGRYLDDTEKQKFMNLFDSGTQINSNVGINYFSLALYPAKIFGAIGFSIQDMTSFNLNFSPAILELILYGNDRKKEFNLNDLDFKAWYLRTYSFTYSRELTNLFPKLFKFVSAGFSVKKVDGFLFASLEKINTTLQTNDNYSILVNGDSRMIGAASPSFGINYDFEQDGIEKEAKLGFFNKPAGEGIGFDFGLYSELNETWSFAFALTDLGSIRWNNETFEYSSSASILLEDITDDKLLDSLGNTLKGEGKYIEPFTTNLAAAMKLGAGFRLDKFLNGKFPGEMMVEFNYNQGFNNLPSNSTNPRLSLGIEWIPISWFNFRTGISVGGYDKFNWALGFGFGGAIDFDFAASYANAIFDGNSAKRLGFGISTRWTF